MELQLYQSHQLRNVLEYQLQQNSSGVLTLKTKVDYSQNKSIEKLVIQNGALVYGGSTIPNNQQFARSLGNQLNKTSIDAALAVAMKKLTNPKSVRELIELLVKLKIFRWEELEFHIHNRVVLLLEKFDAYPGQAKWDDFTDFDLCFGEDCHGLNWTQLTIDLISRRRKWASLAPNISSMYAIPYVRESRRLKLGMLEVRDPRIKEHLDTYVDGRRTLLDIATAMNKDPLIVANSYLSWVKSGIVSLDNITEANNQARTPANTQSDANLPIILSVDDRPIVQLSIKRSLKGHYNVLCSSQPLDALSILGQHPVKLLLLDLTMPVMDGLDFCKQIRGISKFKELPIVIVTARDGIVDQVRGQIAGANGYITKPFTTEELVSAVNNYIKAKSLQ